MIWPNLCIDNFFQEPDKVVTFANSLEYFKPEPSNYPGKRTKHIHEIDHRFFEFTCLKILSLLYPNDYKNLRWNALQTFQKIPANLKYNGWIHTDSDHEFTSIIYLSKFLNCGTSIYHSKNTYGYITNEKIKNEYFKYNDPKLYSKTAKAKEENNNPFEETIKFNSRYNRLILFDGSSYHASNVFNHNNSKEERLTLITFFNTVERIDGLNLKKPLTTMRRIN
jgi:hypothetical protein|tara:strand:+ start:2226 stop:2894 length:669 start_codon:yes stop_codon:yes gene_type:complete